jgi:hypothetical protein
MIFLEVVMEGTSKEATLKQRPGENKGKAYQKC